MAKTKDRGKYQAVSLPAEFVETVRQYVLKNKNYQSIAEFTKQAVIEKFRNDKTEKRMSREFKAYSRLYSSDRQDNTGNIEVSNLLKTMTELTQAVTDLQKEIKKNRY